MNLFMVIQSIWNYRLFVLKTPKLAGFPWEFVMKIEAQPSDSPVIELWADEAVFIIK